MRHKKGLLLIPIVVLVISGWAGIDVVLRLDRIPGSVSELVLQPDVWPKSPSEVTFAVIGDAGTGGVQQFRVASQMAQTYRSEPFGLLLTTGDNVYFGGVVNRVQDVVDKPYRPLFGAGVEFRPSLGNHDVEKDDGDADDDGPDLPATLAALGIPDRYYQFTSGPVDFFALDSNDMDNDQLIWLSDRLACSENAWQVVYLHHPLYSSGAHGSNLELRAVLESALVAGGADIVFTGHDHNYERTLPQQGITHVVTGGGGAQIRSVGSSEFTAVSDADHHFLLARVADGTMRITAIASDGELMDNFAVSPRAALRACNTQ